MYPGGNVTAWQECLPTFSARGWKLIKEILPKIAQVTALRIKKSGHGGASKMPKLGARAWA